METKEFGGKRIVKSGTVAILSAAAIAFLAIGCGEQKTKTNVQQAATSGVAEGTLAATGEKTPAVVATAEGTTAEGEATTLGSTTGEATPAAEGIAGENKADALPPDVAATVCEAIAAPGGVVEILAEGSPDVTSVTLTDAIGTKYPFTYQAATDRWRVLYRVPIRTKTEQLGLSVTAANGANRWKRIWVFVDIGQGAAGMAEADSGR
jgi:hypothetical protein